MSNVLLIFIEGLLTNRSILPTTVVQDVVYNVLVGVVTPLLATPSSATPPHLISSLICVLLVEDKLFCEERQVVS